MRSAIALILCGLLTPPATAQEPDAQPEPAYRIYPRSNVDGANPAPPVMHSTVYPGSPGMQGALANEQAPANGVGLLDNFQLFAGLDGSKTPLDLGLNATFGTRVGFNWGIPILQDAGYGFQIGYAATFSNNAVSFLKNVDGTSQQFVHWLTLGFFQRADTGLNWGIVYDFRYDDYYRHLNTGQVRAQIGFQVTDADELGVWGTHRTQEEAIDFTGYNLTVRPINQMAFFWKHRWENNAVTRVWGGFADSHGRFVLGNSWSPATHTPFLFGADMFVPLNNWLAIWGEANFITPNDSGTVTAFLGFAITPDTASYGRSRFAPVLPTANNTSFPLDVR